MPKKKHNAVTNRLKTKRNKLFKQRKCSNCGIKLSPNEVDDICDECIDQQHLNYLENEDIGRDFFYTGLD